MTINKPKNKKALKKYVPIVAAFILLLSTVKIIKNIENDNKINAEIEKLLEEDPLLLAKAIYVEPFNEVYGENVNIGDISLDLSKGLIDGFKLKKARIKGFKYLRKIDIDEKCEEKGTGKILTVEVTTSKGSKRIKTAKIRKKIYSVFSDGDVVDQTQAQLAYLYDGVYSLIMLYQPNTPTPTQEDYRYAKESLRKLIEDGQIDVDETLQRISYAVQDQDEGENKINDSKRDFIPREPLTYIKITPADLNIPKKNSEQEK